MVLELASLEDADWSEELTGDDYQDEGAGLELLPMINSNKAMLACVVCNSEEENERRDGAGQASSDETNHKNGEYLLGMLMAQHGELLGICYSLWPCARQRPAMVGRIGHNHNMCAQALPPP